MENFLLSKHFYLRPLHFAYYRMAFALPPLSLLSWAEYDLFSQNCALLI